MVHQSHSSLNILNKQNEAIQYTIEKEDQSRKPNVLDATIINTGAGSLKYFGKMQSQMSKIKPHS